MENHANTLSAYRTIQICKRSEKRALNLHVPKLYLNFDRWQIHEMTAKFAHRAGMLQIYILHG